MTTQETGREQAAMQECLRLQSESDSKGFLAAMAGRSPLAPGVSPLYRSALGDTVVSGELALLGDEWAVLGGPGEGLRAYDLDHLVIGPSGVFAIVTLCIPFARVAVTAESVRVNGRRSDIREHAQTVAERASCLLSSVAGAPIVVTPVVAVAAASLVTASAGSAGVEVVSAKRLVRSLTVRPIITKPAAIAGISTMAAESADWTPKDFVVSDAAARRALRFERLRAEVDAARGRRRAWGFSGIVMAAGSGLVAGVAGFQALLHTLSVVVGG